MRGPIWYAWNVEAVGNRGRGTHMHWGANSSVAVAVLIAGVITTIVTAIIRRSPSRATARATREGVLFVVSTRMWQRVLIRTVGIAVLPLAVMLLLAAAFVRDPEIGMVIAGAAMLVGGILFILLARGMKRMRLEVTPDSVWSFGLVRGPNEVPIAELTSLEPNPGDRFGGILAKTGSSTRFGATRLMLGYPQLIDFLQHSRPDLPIPEGSWPLQGRAVASR